MIISAQDIKVTDQSLRFARFAALSGLIEIPDPASQTERERTKSLVDAARWLEANKDSDHVRRFVQRYKQHAPEELLPPAQRRNRIDGEPRRVAIVTPCFFCGGVEWWIYWLARYLDRSKWIISDVVVRHPERIAPAMIEELPRWVRVSTGEAEIGRVTQDADVTLVWGMEDLERLSLRSSVTAAVLHGAQPCKWQRKLVDAALGCGFQLTAVSPPCLVNVPRSARNSVAVIENGADVSRVLPRRGREATRLSHGWKGKKVVLSHGRIYKDKNPEVIVDAVRLLGKDWQAVLVGPNWYGDQLAELTGRAPGQVQIVPPTPEIGDLLAAADVHVVASDHESFCFAMIEAWLAGLPSVSTLHQAARWMKDEGADFVPVSVRPKPEVMAQAIREAVAGGSGGSRSKMAAERWTATQMAVRWEDWLASTLRGIARDAPPHPATEPA